MMALGNMRLIQMQMEKHATATRFMVPESSISLDTKAMQSVRRVATDQHGAASGLKNGAAMLKLR